MDEQSDEIKTKNKEIKELKKEIDKRPLPKDVEKTMEVNDFIFQLAQNRGVCFFVSVI